MMKPILVTILCSSVAELAIGGPMIDSPGPQYRQMREESAGSSSISPALSKVLAAPLSFETKVIPVTPLTEKQPSSSLLESEEPLKLQLKRDPLLR